MVWSVFNRIWISSGAIASVRPKPETAALLAAAVSPMRSRPGSDPGHRTLVHGVLVGGLEGLLELIAAGAA
jgi:hypothetical protein